MVGGGGGDGGGWGGVADHIYFILKRHTALVVRRGIIRSLDPRSARD